MLLLGQEVFYLIMECLDILGVLDLFVQERDQVLQGVQAWGIFSAPSGQDILKDRMGRWTDKIGKFFLQGG